MKKNALFIFWVLNFALYGAIFGGESSSVITNANSYALSVSERDKLEAAAEKGDSSAAFRLYLFYSNVAHDEESANRYLKAAAKLGHLGAQYTLGVLLREFGKNDLERAEGLKWLRSASKAGDVDAKKYLEAIDRNESVLPPPNASQ